VIAVGVRQGSARAPRPVRTPRPFVVHHRTAAKLRVGGLQSE
jgi:hypothetical protein